ncbi:MAG: hypothetical protein CMC13_00350 [Flavobacteriaceae bacterium]|nr:hypothetical protein [Flavobacteriaceae bacterium]|tara:strand:- start:27525 stop:27800 length:276 start_codon:yes stop_codon:yes gene_type:complete
MVKSKRKGVLIISEAVFYDENQNELFASIYKVFRPYFIDNTMVPFDRKIKVFGVNKSFEEIEEGEKIPEYLVEVKTSKRGSKIESIKFIKK